MVRYKDFSMKQYKDFLSQPFAYDYGISDDKIIDWFLNDTNQNVQTDIIQYYGLTKKRLKNWYIPTIKKYLGDGAQIMVFIIIGNEGGGAGNFINHYQNNTGGEGHADFIDDMKYIKSTFDKHFLPAVEAPEVNGKLSEDKPGTLNNFYNDIPTKSVGSYYMPSTLAGNAWTFGADWCERNNVYFGNPYDQAIYTIKKLGGNPFKHPSKKTTTHQKKTTKTTHQKNTKAHADTSESEREHTIVTYLKKIMTLLKM